MSNRVSENQGQNSIGWNYVGSEDNAVELASWGIDPDATQAHSLWWNGPDWFITGIFPEPFFSDEVLEEQKKAQNLSFHASSALDQVALDSSKYNSRNKVF